MTRLAPDTPLFLLQSRLLELAARRRASELLFAPSSGALPAPGTPGQPATASAMDSHGPEFILVTAGHARVASAGAVFELTPGRLLTLARAAEHYELPTQPESPYDMFWCTLEGTQAALGAHSYRPPGVYRTHAATSLEGQTDLESIANAVVSELRNQHWGWQEAAHGLLKYLSRMLVRRLQRNADISLRTGESPAVAADPHTWRIIRATLLFCDRSLRRNVRLNDAAKAVGYSPGYLSHLLSTHLGHTFSEHLQNLRIDTGRRLLDTTDLSIREIAHQVGYGEASNFSHAFTRVVGLSPKAYRERQRGL
jgi:AraC-like DNA-binding protein